MCSQRLKLSSRRFLCIFFSDRFCAPLYSYIWNGVHGGGDRNPTTNIQTSRRRKFHKPARTGLALQLESALIFHDSHISHQEDAKNVVEAGAQKKQADCMNRYDMNRLCRFGKVAQRFAPCGTHAW